MNTSLNETLELLNIELPCELFDFIDSGREDLSDHLHETDDGFWVTKHRLENDIREQAGVVVGRLETAIETAEDKYPHTTAADDLRDFQSILENL